MFVFVVAATSTVAYGDVQQNCKCDIGAANCLVKHPGGTTTHTLKYYRQLARIIRHYIHMLSMSHITQLAAISTNQIALHILRVVIQAQQNQQLISTATITR